MRMMRRRTQRGESTFGGLLIAVIFMMTGVFVAAFVPLRGGVHCTPDPPVCVIKRGSLVMPETRRILAADIAKVVVEEGEGSEGPRFRPTLVLKDGMIEPMITSFTNFGDPQSHAAKVRNWLAAPQSELRVEAGSSWLVVLVGAILLLLGRWFFFKIWRERTV